MPPRRGLRKMRRTIVLASMLALLLASCGADTDEGKDAEPTGAAGTPSPAITPSSSTSEPSESSPTGISVADLEGTWIGEVPEPGYNAMWSRVVTIGSCEIGATCGRLDDITRDWGSKDKTRKCSIALTYEGFRPDLGAFAFQEDVEAGRCVDALLAIVPLPSGIAIAVEEDAPVHGWATHGVLLLSFTS
jgi:hypothetical protein